MKVVLTVPQVTRKQARRWTLMLEPEPVAHLVEQVYPPLASGAVDWWMTSIQLRPMARVSMQDR
jgi:hypothetical protein